MPIDQIIKITGAGTASSTVNDVASIDMPADSLIVGILGIIEAVGGMSNDSRAAGELSFLSTNQIDANDSRGVISQIGLHANAIVTSGGAGKASEQCYQNLPDGIPIASGERLHLHILSSSAFEPVVTFILYVAGSGSARRSSRRR